MRSPRCGLLVVFAAAALPRQAAPTPVAASLRILALQLRSPR